MLEQMLRTKETKEMKEMGQAWETKMSLPME
jgi:hypothetical protein